MMTYIIAVCSLVGCSPSMLAQGRAAILVRIAFNSPTIYNNRYAREGKTSTTGDSQRMSVAAGMTMKFVSRK